MVNFRLQPYLLPLVLIILTSCSTGVNGIQYRNGEWQRHALHNQHVNVLQVTDQKIFTGTNQGVYFADFADTSWQNIGLESAKILSLVIIPEQKILAPAYFTQQDSSAIVFTQNQGENWSSLNTDFGGSQSMTPHIISSHPNDSNVLYARGVFNVAKSIDAGKTWNLIYGVWDGIGASHFLKINNYQPTNIWAGGATASFEPHLITSTDGGETWKRIIPIENIESTCYDIALFRDSNKVVVGMQGRIIKSTDGGQSWETVLEGINTRTLTHSASNPEIVYASGINENGSLFFAASSDFGESWERVEWADSPTGVQVNDMVSVMEGGREVLYFGTNKGVFSYTFENE